MTKQKTVPNQKAVRVSKEQCDKTHLYATINLQAMEKAARELDAGAFKLWVYFAKNQNGYEFALSSKAVEETFGMKIKQYNNAVKELIDKGFLVMTKGNNYIFNEIAVIPKGNNDVMPKSNNVVIPKGNNALSSQGIRNITDNTLDNTIDNTVCVLESKLSKTGAACRGQALQSCHKPEQALTKAEMVERFKREMGF